MMILFGLGTKWNIFILLFYYSILPHLKALSWGYIPQQCVERREYEGTFRFPQSMVTLRVAIAAHTK